MLLSLNSFNILCNAPGSCFTENIIEVLVKKINDAVNSISFINSFEIIMINDCSPDKTHEECLKLTKEYPSELTYIKLSKNVGEHNAVMAGLNFYHQYLHNPAYHIFFQSQGIFLF